MIAGRRVCDILHIYYTEILKKHLTLENDLFNKCPKFAVSGERNTDDLLLIVCGIHHVIMTDLDIPLDLAEQKESNRRRLTSPNKGPEERIRNIFESIVISLLLWSPLMALKAWKRKLR
jgi:hypothetical protein